MKRILILISAFLLLSLPAVAEEIDLSTEGYDNLYNGYCSLPDGRIVVAGGKADKGNYQNQRARLICLNPDGSISWEYVDPTLGNCSFSTPVLLTDGTVGTTFRNSPDQSICQMEIRKFSQEGEPLGTPVDIYVPDMGVCQSINSCIEYAVIPPTAQTYYRYFIDWEGHILFKVFSESGMSGVKDMLPLKDGILLYGTDNGYPSPAKLLKTDLYGNVLWETVVPTWQDEGDANLTNGFQTSDGGYVFWLMESSGNPLSELEWHTALVKFDENGRQVWANHHLPQNVLGSFRNRGCHDIQEYEGKLVVAMGTKNYDDGEPHHYLWFSADGEYLGHSILPVEGRASGSSLTIVGDVLYDKKVTYTKHEEYMDTQDSFDVKLYPVPLPSF